MAKALMVQGTASNVGKSVLCTALCRIFRQDGFRVAPFKSQNMSRRSFVTENGEEIGVAQAVQAEAAGISPLKAMNPILIKPCGGSVCELLVEGEAVRTARGREYGDAFASAAFDRACLSYGALSHQYDVIVIEGAGSPAEINIKDRDIANMRTAKMAGAFVILVGDIDLGGVFASLLGTLEILDESERALIGGLVINKYRGDKSVLGPGLDFLERRTGKPVLGVLPYVDGIGVAEEDINLAGRADPDGPESREEREAAYDRLAEAVRGNLDMRRVYAGVGLAQRKAAGNPWR